MSASPKAELCPAQPATRRISAELRRTPAARGFAGSTRPELRRRVSWTRWVLTDGNSYAQCSDELLESCAPQPLRDVLPELSQNPRDHARARPLFRIDAKGLGNWHLFVIVAEGCVLLTLIIAPVIAVVIAVVIVREGRREGNRRGYLLISDLVVVLVVGDGREFAWDANPAASKCPNGEGLELVQAVLSGVRKVDLFGALFERYLAEDIDELLPREGHD